MPPPYLPPKLALTILHRLEAATSRLEDLVPGIGDTSASTNGIQALPDQGSSDSRALKQARSPSTHMETLPPVIDDFDAIINGEVKTFVNMSEEIGGLVAEQVSSPEIFYENYNAGLLTISKQSAAVLRAFAAERKFLIVTTKAKKPDIQSPIYMEILKELQAMMGAVNDIREANRASPLFTHLTTVSEGIAVLGWITIDPKPAQYVSEVLSSSQFYGNRVIKEYKERSIHAVLSALEV